MQTQRKNIIVLLLITFITTLTSLTSAYSQSDSFIVVLDAGHGGKDSGAAKNGYMEKEIALDVVLELGKMLEKVNGVKIIYTRKTDVFIELWKRADIANKADADLFVSIHCNSVNNPSPYGTETWVLGENNSARNFEFAKRENEVIFLEENYEENYAGFDPSSPESEIALSIEQGFYVEQSVSLARKIEDNFITKAKRKSRGLKQHSLLVIRNTYMPSVLVELGFISNKQEGKFLNSEAGQNKMANALKDAILAYKNEIDQNVGHQITGADNERTKGQDEQYVNNEAITYKVQIAASSRDLEPKSYNFRGLVNLSKEKTGRLYKYYYGSTLDLEEAKLLQEEAKSKGYTSSFLVGFKDGKKIDISKY
ncbi:MAG: N-acetylmuramoyl-L-alanine amidase [Winogradskyella sp.]|uniref:N-acetylmuramoyl-L-alanine amidase family protein n=1 Tax=Winogradskyella sp. TaxID=1883156 RepID=UPI0025F6D520|nr:N-acetylmuramoyl-L-alanine amidase [Winogradskyella sp.]NRB82160.1 N-acetylmuramoyl-L-alanine amidase [Winogradskyella sp.]